MAGMAGETVKWRQTVFPAENGCSESVKNQKASIGLTVGVTVETAGGKMILQGYNMNQLLEATTKSDGTAASQSGDSGTFAGFFRDAMQARDNVGKSVESQESRENFSADTKEGAVEQFRQFVRGQATMLQMNVNETLVGDDALKDMQAFLVNAGFSTEKVAALMEELQADSGGEGITVASLLEALDNLEDETVENMIDITALPYIESILTGLGLEQEKIVPILEDATVEGQGISPSALSEGLKGLMASQAGAGESGDSITSDGENLLQFMDRIGLKDGNGTGGKMTLDSFIAKLEAIAGVGDDSPASGNVLGENLSDFWGKIKNENASSSVSADDLQIQVPLSGQMGSAIDTKRIAGSAKNGETVNPLDVFFAENSDATKAVAEALVKNQGSREFMDSRGENNGSDTGSRLMKAADDAGNTFETLLRDASGASKGAAAKTAAPSGRTLPAYVVNQVSRQVVNSVQNNESELSFQIKPPHLGRLNMSIEQTQGGVRISILAEQNTARDMLASHTHDLKTVLAEQGIRVEKVDVQISYNFDQAMENFRQNQQGNKKGGRQNARTGEDSSVGAAGVVSGETELPRIRDGGLNLVA